MNVIDPKLIQKTRRQKRNEKLFNTFMVIAFIAMTVFAVLIYCRYGN
jgi:heme/copper-type cytochrome/quinol oxidase subunit 2